MANHPGKAKDIIIAPIAMILRTSLTILALFYLLNLLVNLLIFFDLLDFEDIPSLQPTS